MTVLPIIVYFLVDVRIDSLHVFPADICELASNSICGHLFHVVGYQYDVSGKPLLGAAAFVPIAFEMTVLFSALNRGFWIACVLNKLAHVLPPRG